MKIPGFLKIRTTLLPIKEFSEIDYLDETYEYDFGTINDENDQST